MSDNRNDQGFDDWFNNHFGDTPPPPPAAPTPDDENAADEPAAPAPPPAGTPVPPPAGAVPPPVVPQQPVAPLQPPPQFPTQQQPMQPPPEHWQQTPAQPGQQPPAGAWPQTQAPAAAWPPPQPGQPAYPQQPMQRPAMPQQPMPQQPGSTPTPPPATQPPGFSTQATPHAPQSFAPQQPAHPTFDPSLPGQDAVATEHLTAATQAAAGAGETSALDALFGDDQFRDWVNDPAPVPAPATGSDPADAADQPKGISRTHITLMWIAGSAVALLALVAFFLVGTRLPTLTGSNTTPTTEPTVAPTERPEGPVAPGTYNWNELLGGECLADFRGAWENEYTVVDCAEPHAAQLVIRAGVPVASGTGGAYPGVAELQSRMNLLCTDAAVVDYSAANQYDDMQFEASFPPSVEEWDAGRRDYFCFISRASGQPIDGSLVAPPAPEEPVTDESTEGTEETEAD